MFILNCTLSLLVSEILHERYQSALENCHRGDVTRLADKLSFGFEKVYDNVRASPVNVSAKRVHGNSLAWVNDGKQKRKFR